MRKIVNKKVEDLEYMEIYISALRLPENGERTDYEEMDRILPIIRKVKNIKVKEHALLEDAEYNELLKRIKKYPFLVNDEAAHAVVQHVINAEKVPVTEK